MINGIERIAITKLDVLDQFEEIKVCIGYEYGGKRLKTFPTDVESLTHITPIYESFEGWKSTLAGVTSYADIPTNARRYIEALAHLSGTSLWIVSVGPRRDQTIVIE
jgi:adenylosuccinate synthase